MNDWREMVEAARRMQRRRRCNAAAIALAGLTVGYLSGWWTRRAYWQ